MPSITGNFISWSGGIELSSATSSLASCYPSKMISTFDKRYKYKLESLISTDAFKKVLSTKIEITEKVSSPKNELKKRPSFSKSSAIKPKSSNIAINKKIIESYCTSIADDLSPGDTIESYFPLIPISNVYNFYIILLIQASVEEIKIVSAAIAIQKSWRGFNVRKHTISRYL